MEGCEALLWEVELKLTEGLYLSQLPVSNLPCLHPHKQSKPVCSRRWQTSLDNPFNVDLHKAISHTNISKIKWQDSDFNGVQRSDKGSEGLFLVEAKGNEVFIVKRSSSIASEVFCNLLAMKMRLHCAKVRVIIGSSIEGDDMLNCLQKLDKEFRVVTTLSNQAHLLLMEFIRGQTLRDIFENTEPFAIGVDLLTQIGEVMALDILTNNSDRLPLVWQNEGNFGNIMVSERGPIVLPIDNKVVPIDGVANKNIYDGYVKGVQGLLATLHLNQNNECPQFRRIRELIIGCTGYHFSLRLLMLLCLVFLMVCRYDMGVNGTTAMQNGFKRAIERYNALDIESFTAEMNDWVHILQSHRLEINPLTVPFVVSILNVLRSPPLFELSYSLEKSKEQTDEVKLKVDSGVSVMNIADECMWRRIIVDGDMPSPRRYHSGVLYQNSLYIFGGVGPSKLPTNELYTFDFGKKQWSLVYTKGTPPTPRCAHIAVVHHNQMWVFGGYDNQRTAFSDLFSFNFGSSEWTQHHSVEGEIWPTPRYFHSATIFSNHLYILGGAVAKSKYFDEVFEFSFEDKKWQLSTPLPSAKAGHISFEYGNKLYVYGGFSGDGGFDNHIELHYFDFGNGRWDECDVSGTFPRTARALSCIAFRPASNDSCYVYVYGGYDGKNPMCSLLCLSVLDLKWKPIRLWLEMGGSFSFSSSLSMSQNFLPIPRYGHCTIVNEIEGTITVFGGSGSSPICQRKTPASHTKGGKTLPTNQKSGQPTPMRGPPETLGQHRGLRVTLDL